MQHLVNADTFKGAGAVVPAPWAQDGPKKMRGCPGVPVGSVWLDIDGFHLVLRPKFPGQAMLVQIARRSHVGPLIQKVAKACYKKHGGISGKGEGNKRRLHRGGKPPFRSSRGNPCWHPLRYISIPTTVSQGIISVVHSNVFFT